MTVEQEGKYVFLLWHSRPTSDHPESPDTNDKLLGVFDSEEGAKAAKQEAITQPGFRDWPDAFEVGRYQINLREWPEGFVDLD